MTTVEQVYDGSDFVVLDPELKEKAMNNVAGIKEHLDEFIEHGDPFSRYFMVGVDLDEYTKALHSLFINVMNKKGIVFTPLEEDDTVAVAKIKYGKLLWRRTDFNADGEYGNGEVCGYFYRATEHKELPLDIKLPKYINRSAVLT